MKEIKIQPKSREHIETEIGNILAGKDHSQRGMMLRNAARALSAFNTKEEIKEMFVKEYIKKYGQLERGEKTLEQIKQEAVKDSKDAGNLVK